MSRPVELNCVDAPSSSLRIATNSSLGLENGDQCKICNVAIPRGSNSVTVHFLSKEHAARAREMGVYCTCGKNFLNPARFPYHQCVPPSTKRLGVAPRKSSSCQICGISIRSQDALRKHKDSKKHLDRTKELGYKCACVRFFLDLATMERHKCFDERIPNQTDSIGNGTGTSHPPLSCTGCKVEFFSEKEFFAYHAGHKGVHSPVWTNLPKGVCAPISTCKHCGVDFYQGGSSKAHKKMQSHIDLLIPKGLYCIPCKAPFSNDAIARKHWRRVHDPNAVMEFRCCDCQQGFRTNKRLNKHACPCVPPAGYHACEPCNLRFPNKMMLLLHLNSKDHKPVKCLGGSGCARKFKDLPGMLQHLESGSCKSKMDRKAIDALLRKHDTGNIITIEGAGEVATPAILPSWPSASHISTASTVFEEVETDSDGEDSGGVIFTPTSSPPRRGSVDSGAPTPIGLPTPTIIDSYGFTRALTPLSGGISELESRLRDPLVCPICSKKFNNPGGLTSHIASPVHAVPKYHCPKEFLEGMGMKMDRHGVERTFKTLSGLAQHIHVRACTADKDAWAKMLQFLEGKLSGLGYDGVRLLSQ